MKHLREEKIGLRINHRFNKILVFIFFSAKIFAQVPFNGFCKYDSYSFTPGYQSAFTLNYNSDFYTDVILLAHDEKKIVSLRGEQSGVLKQEKITPTPFPISKLMAITDKNNNVIDYFFLSRKARKAGIIKFDRYGGGTVHNRIDLDSYPENISTADIDDNEEKDILISGPSFNGLSLLKKSGNKFEETKLFEKKAFSFASFIDINNDGYPDIAAFDLMENTLIFYYNNGRGEFRHVKNIPFYQQVKQMQVLDYDLDSFQDIMLVTDNQIRILFGDGVASYSKEEIINTKQTADKLLWGDFNRDGKIDIVYLNNTESTVSVIFGREYNKTFPEMKYLSRELLTDLIPYYSRFVSGFAALSVDGTIHTITQVASLSPEVEITFGGEPSLLGSFDYSNNGIIDLFYIDKNNKTSNFILRDGNGIPSIFYSVNLYDAYSSVKVDDTERYNKSFYFYTNAKKTIEILIIDFKKFEVTREYIYTGGEISDLKVVRQNDATKSDIIVTNLPNRTLTISEYSYKDFRYTVKTSTGIADSVFDAKIDGSLGVYFWRKFPNNVTLYHHTATAVQQQERLYSTKLPEEMKTFNFTYDVIGRGNEALVSIVISPTEKYVLISGVGLQNKTTRRSITKYFKDFREERVFFGKTERGKENKMYLYLPEEKSLNKVEFTHKGGVRAITKLTEMRDAENFIVGKFSAGNYHVVYSNKSNASLIIQKI